MIFHTTLPDDYGKLKAMHFAGKRWSCNNDMCSMSCYVTLPYCFEFYPGGFCSEFCLLPLICIITITARYPGPSFIKPDQLHPWIKDQLRNALLSTILSLQLPNSVSCGRACPSHRTQNLVTVGTKLLTREWFSFDPWSMDQADLVW